MRRAHVNKDKPRKETPSMTSHKRRFISRSAIAPLAILFACTALYGQFDIFETVTSSQQQDDEGEIHRSVGTNEPSDLYKGMPSPKRICNIILDHQKEQPATTEAEISSSLKWETGTIIEESQKTCFDEITPTQSLAQMFVSDFVSRQGRAHGIGVEYQHNCQQWPSTTSSPSFNNASAAATTATIQQWIPSPMEYPQDVGTIDLRMLRNFCEDVVADQDDAMYLGLKLLYHDLYSVSLLDFLVSSLRMNLQTAVSKWISFQESNLEGQQQQQLSLGEWFMSNFASAPTEDNSMIQERAVVSIECFGLRCHDVIVLPLFMYAMMIPSYVTTIDILVPQACVDNAENCYEHSENVKQYLSTLHPRSTVSIIVDSPASMNFMGRKVQADILMCGPGWSLDCLFPSLARDVKNQDGDRVILLEEGDSVPLEYKLSFALDHVSPQRKTHLLHFPTPMRTVLSEKKDDPETFKTLLNARPYTNSCHRIRGMMGSWVKDMDLAPQMQYDWYLHHRHGWADKALRVANLNGEETGLEYLPSTTYRWVDNISGNPEKDFCKIELITLEGVCSTLQFMGIERLFFLGDSLQYQQVQSLWMLLKQDRHGPEPNLPPDNLRPNFKHTVSCPNMKFEFDIEYIRNDQLIENSLPVSMEPGELTMNCKNICFPWTSNFVADPRRTLFVVNTGAHFQKDSEFQATFDHFMLVMEQITSSRDVEDIVLFRTSVSGHKGCNAPGLVPHENYESFVNRMKAENDRYGWSGFAKYNDYVTHAIEKMRWDEMKQVDEEISQRKQKRKFKVEMLDVSPMTVLRQDGHLGDEFRPPVFKNKIDCLHYSLPGPVDWWNHLMFNNLVDIGNEEYVAKNKAA